MNALEQLKQDVWDALELAEGGAPYYTEDKAAMTVLDTFIEKYEAVEVDKVEGDFYIDVANIEGEALTILVPRKQEPTLLEAVLRAADAMDKVNSTDVADFMAARTALRTAIAKEQENE